MGAFLLLVLFLSIPQSKKIVDPPLESQVSTIESKADKPSDLSNVYKPTDLMKSICSSSSYWSIEKCAEYHFDQADFINSRYFTKASNILKDIGNEAALAYLISSKRPFETYRDSLCDADYWSTQGSRRDYRLYNCKERITKQYTYEIWSLLMIDPADIGNHWPGFPEPIFNIILDDNLNVITDNYEPSVLEDLDPEEKLCFQGLAGSTTPMYADQAFKAFDSLRVRVSKGLKKTNTDEFISKWTYPCGLLSRKLSISEGVNNIWYDVDFNGDLKIPSVR
jgi:hypothetical protein